MNSPDITHFNTLDKVIAEDLDVGFAADMRIRRGSNVMSLDKVPGF